MVLASLRDLVCPAFFVLMRAFVILTQTIRTKGAHTVHRLSASIRGALLESLRIRTTKAVVCGIRCNLIHAAPLVLVVVGVVVALRIRTKAAHTIHRLTAS